MIRKLFLTALLLGAATPALAQPDVAPPGPWVALQDKPTCTRAELKAAAAAYVEAQRNGNISTLPLDPKAHFLENMATVDRAAGLWNRALPIAHAMSFHDDKRCKTFTEIVITGGGHPYVIGTRLYMHQGKIIRVDSLVTDKGDWLFNAAAYNKYTTLDNWQPLPAAEHTAPAEMIRGANAYLDSFADKFTDIPWGTPCARLEGGAYTNRDNKPDASCAVGIPPGVLYIVNRDYLVDGEMGVINVFCRFGNSASGMPDSHSFRFARGKIRGVHTLSVNLTANPSPQADDNGGMIRNAPPARS